MELEAMMKERDVGYLCEIFGNLGVIRRDDL